MEVEGRRLTMKKVPLIEGEVVKSDIAVSFLGDIDPDTGLVTNRKNNLYGVTIKNKVFAFPSGKGSTVGSYVMYRLAKNSCGPKAILNERSETIVAVGAVISNIPLLDDLDLRALRTGQKVQIRGGTVHVMDPEVDDH
jgi:predicted aconitase with swiveling domain